MPLNVSEMPSELRIAFGNYAPCIFDSACGEPVGWGFKLLRELSRERWSEAQHYGELVFGGAIGSWVLVTKWLTPAEAIEKYGDVTDIERGPRGGFRSVVYGDKRFLSKRLDPGK
jgi:hypothetical protein